MFFLGAFSLWQPSMKLFFLSFLLTHTKTLRLKKVENAKTQLLCFSQTWFVEIVALTGPSLSHEDLTCFYTSPLFLLTFLCMWQFYTKWVEIKCVVSTDDLSGPSVHITDSSRSIIEEKYVVFQPTESSMLLNNAAISCWGKSLDREQSSLSEDRETTGITMGGSSETTCQS